VAQHRHTPEIEQGLSDCAGKTITVSFTPHLLPVSRGILSTMYGNLKKSITASELRDLYRESYGNEKFVRINPEGVFPNISSVQGSNYIDIGVTVDPRTRRTIIISAIDNLIKGASGQAVQNMNLMCGLPEGTGLEIVPIYP
jgi:N-acetyl-gamma-glutamyl-phosphate reductase